MLLKVLADRGVRTVDLRPALLAERTLGKVYYLHDAHWTARGAIAGFNAIADATSHSDWRIDPDSALGPSTTILGGDLARLAGINDNVTEFDQPLVLPYGHRETFAPGPLGPPFAEIFRGFGPTVLIIGNSFTHDLLAPMLGQHVGRVVWVHNLFCGFDWKWVEAFKPDEVWWMPTERQMLCRPGVRPLGLPSE